MARTEARPDPTAFETLEPLSERCRACDHWLRIDYFNWRTVHTLTGRVRLTLKIRRCHHRDCSLYLTPYRPEEEGAWALPAHEFGLDVIAFIGHRRYVEKRSLPEIHRELVERGVGISQRAVNDLAYRYEELVTLSYSDRDRLVVRLKEQGKVILAVDGLQPEKGQTVLWVVRDTLSRQVLLARSLPGSSAAELATLLEAVRHLVKGAGVPVVGVISDGQVALRRAVATVFPNVPHQLCQFHYLREASKEIVAADRQAKVELQRQVRGIRAIERAVAGRTDQVAEVVEGYCEAVRAALHAPAGDCLSTPGLALHSRLEEIERSLAGVLTQLEGYGPKKGALLN